MKNKLKKDMFFSIGNQIVNIILPLISAPVVSRAIGVEGVGIQAVVAANASYFRLLALSGLQNYGNRTIAMQQTAQDRSRAFLEIYSMQLFFGIVSVVSYLLLFVANGTMEMRHFYAANTFYVLGAVLDISWYYYGKSEFKFITLRNLLIRTLSFIAIILFVHSPQHVGRYVFIIGISSFLSALLLWTKLLQETQFILPSWHGIVQHIRPNLILFIPVLAMSVYRVMDKSMIGIFSGNIQAGLYENADRIISISLVVFTAIGTVMLPHSSKIVAQGKFDQLKSMMRDAMQLQMAVAICISMGIYCVANKAVPIYFGEDFTAAVPVLQILSVVPLMSVWKSVLRTQYLIPTQKDKMYAASLIGGACTNVVLNLILIPKFGACGAAIGTLGAELTGLLLQTLPFRKELPYHDMLRDMIPFVFSSICMGAMLFFTDIFVHSFITLVIDIAAACIVYSICALCFLRVFQRNRFDILLHYIGGKKLKNTKAQ